MNNHHITELGRRFGLSRSTLLYYDRIGLLSPSSRTQADYRLYTQQDVDKLERICFFRDAGLSLTEIARLLEKNTIESPILEKRLREIGHEIAVLKAQQHLVAGILKTVSAGPAASGLDRELWLDLHKACGFDEKALKRWHIEFERRAPQAHHEFLMGLGLTEKEATQVRMLTKNIKENKMEMKYFFELFEDLPRQGPGCQEATLTALGLLKGLPTKPAVLDIGCGRGMQTQILARELKTKIIAIDNHRPFLDYLDGDTAQNGLDIETHEMSMIDMPFDRESFDMLWAEGSIFIIGLVRGLNDFRNYLKPGGFFAFTEMCWFVNEPPQEAQAYLDSVYPDIKTVDEVRMIANASGYQVVETFNLPSSAWWDDYYTPMLKRMEELKVKHAGVAEAQAVYTECEMEIEMFRRHSNSYGYTFFVLQRPR